MRRSLIVLSVLVPVACASPETPRELAGNVSEQAPPEEVRSDARVSGEDVAEAVEPEAPPPPPVASPGPESPPVLETLAPYFELDPLHEAMLAWEAGERGAAIDGFEAFANAHADDPRAPAARLMAAWLLTDEDRTGALAQLERLAGEWPLMADAAWVRAAELHAHGGRAERVEDRRAALAALDKVEAGSIHLGRALALRTALLLADDQGEAALAALAEAAARWPERLLAASWAELARLRDKARDEAGAKAARLELAVRFPSDELGKEALRELPVSELSARERLRLGEALFAAWRFDAMRGVIGTLKAPKEAACEAWILLGRAAERKKKDDEGALEKAWDYYKKALACEGEPRAWATFLGGRARLAKDPKQARKLLQAHADEFPERSTADDALLLLAESDKRKKRQTKTLLATLRRYPQGDMADAVAWDLVGPHVEARKWEEVLRTTEQVLAIAPDDVPGRHPGRYRYWRGRALWELGKQDEARAAWREVFQSHPLSWYAVLALSRLTADGTEADAVETLVPAVPGPVGPPDLRVPAALWRDVHFRRAVEWARIAGARHDRASPFLALVEEELDAVAKDARPAGDAWDWLRVEVQQLAGGYPRSMRIARWLEAERGLPFPVGAAAEPWKLAYPRPFLPHVRRWAEERALDPFWIWAVMRVESNFDPEAVSWANAIGLMQIILPTAKFLSRGTEHEPTRDNLMRPEVAVELGTKYLERLLGRHKVLPLASAGYNAGGGAVAKWRRQFGDVEVDEFVERIPYREAHLYAKSVTQTWARYRWLYGGELATIDLSPVGAPDATATSE